MDSKIELTYNYSLIKVTRLISIKSTFQNTFKQPSCGIFDMKKVGNGINGVGPVWPTVENKCFKVRY